MADRIDTRDLVQELEELREDGDIDGLDPEDRERIEILRKVLEEIADAEDGVTLIPEDDFEDYAQELAEDVCEMPDEVHWPFTCIDWTQAANDLASDYSTVEFDGDSYYYRGG